MPSWFMAYIRKRQAWFLTTSEFYSMAWVLFWSRRPICGVHALSMLLMTEPQHEYGANRGLRSLCTTFENVDIRDAAVSSQYCCRSKSLLVAKVVGTDCSFNNISLHAPKNAMYLWSYPLCLSCSKVADSIVNLSMWEKRLAVISWRFRSMKNCQLVPIIFLTWM